MSVQGQKLPTHRAHSAARCRYLCVRPVRSRQTRQVRDLPIAGDLRCVMPWRHCTGLWRVVDVSIILRRRRLRLARIVLGGRTESTVDLHRSRADTRDRSSSARRHRGHAIRLKAVDLHRAIRRTPAPISTHVRGQRLLRAANRCCHSDAHQAAMASTKLRCSSFSKNTRR